MLKRILTGLSRFKEQPIGKTYDQGRRLIRDTLAAARYLRVADSVGPGARVEGHPRIENRGKMILGRELFVHSHYAPLELIAEGGTIEIGDQVWLNFGTVIHARKHVHIGDRTMIAQYVIIADTEMGPLESFNSEPREIRIGADVWVAGRVTVLPGVTIGDGSVIAAGSVVASDIPPRVIAGGVPARVLRALGPGESAKQHQPQVIGPPLQALATLPELKGQLISALELSALAEALADAREQPQTSLETTTFEEAQGDFAIVWTQAEIALPGFRKLLEREEIGPPVLLADADAFCARVESIAQRFKRVFVPSWVPSWTRGLTLPDRREVALGAVNLHLAERLARTPNVRVLNTQRWLDDVDPLFSQRDHHLGQPFTADMLARVASDLKAALRALDEPPRKLLVFELDETLWGGRLAEQGLEKLKLGGVDPEGRAFADLQRAARSLKQRGVLLATVSQGDANSVNHAFRDHSGMVLREEDLAARRSGTETLEVQLASIAAELKLELREVAFVSGNQGESARMRAAHPAVLVPDLGTDKLRWPDRFFALRCFGEQSF
jgi:acetyltransferase-like isoleucine patch superfamily enzyme